MDARHQGVDEVAAPPPTRPAGRYVLRREIGHGGAAVIHLALDRRTRRAVAIKELAVAAGDERRRARFAREASIGASLRHRNIVSVHGLVDDGRRMFIVMEYLERGSLRGRMSSLALPQILGALDGILAALVYAHGHGVVHRDLKPENVLVDARGRVKVTDFGLARAADDPQASATGTAAGTPAYMAPEQAVGGAIGPQTDLYALGVLAYELLAGRLPFQGAESPLELIGRHLTVPPTPLLEAAPGVDPALAAFVDGLLAKVPADRPRSAAQARAELGGIASRLLGPGWRRHAAIEPRRHGRARRAAIGTTVLCAAAALVAVPDWGGSHDAAIEGTQLAVIPVGHSGDRLPLAAVAERTIWVTNYLDDTVSRVDARTGREVLPRIAVGRHPSDVAADRLVWVVNDRAGTVSLIDPRQATVVGRPIRVGANPAAVVVSGGYGWVTLFDADAVRPVDAGGSHAAAPAVPVGRRPNGIAAAAGAIWVANYGDGTVSRIDPARLRVAGSPIRTGAGPTDVTGGGGAVWVANSGSGTVARIDPATRRRDAVVDVGGRPFCVASSRGRVWATVDDELVEIDARRARIAARRTIGGSDNCVRAGGAGVWLTLRGADAVARLRG